MMHKKLLLPIFYFSLSVLILTSCDDDDEPETPVIPNEEEVITTLNLTLVDNANGDTVVFSFRDLDGDGGNAPIITEGVLASETSYIATIEVLNEIENPVEDITLEVIEEAAEHQFFFQTTLVGTNISYADQDSDGNPLGVLSILETSNPESGTLTVTLRHEPDKSAPGVSAGEIDNAGGETDIEVVFNVDVE